MLIIGQGLNMPKRNTIVDDLIEFRMGRKYRILYRNWKGKVSYRNIKSAHIVWDTCLYHSPTPAIYLRAFDMDKNDLRDFLPKDILHVSEMTSRWHEFWKRMDE